MNCKIENTTDQRLIQLVQEFGQEEGLRRFLKSPDKSYSSVGLNTAKNDSSVVLKRLEELKYSLQDSLNKTKDRAIILKLRKDISNVNEQLELLRDETSAENVLQVFDLQEKQIKSIFKQPIISQNNLALVKQMINVWKDSKQYFVAISDIDNENLEIVKALNSVEVRAKDLDIQYTKILGNALYERWLENTSTKDKEDPRYKKFITTIMPDVNALSSYSYDLGSMDNLVAQLMAKEINNSFRMSKDELTKMVTKEQELKSKLSKSDQSNPDWMLNQYKNNKGQEELDFVSPISNDYYEEKRKISSKLAELKEQLKTSTEQTKPKYQKLFNEKLEEFNQWRKENEVTIDIRYLDFYPEYGDIKQGDKTNYKSFLIQELGSSLANKIILDAEQSYVNYLLDKEAYETDQERLVLEGELLEERKDENIEEWELSHNPIYRLQYLEGQKTTEASKNNVNNKGYVYLKTIGNKKWIDSKYLAIQANEAQRNYYEYVRANIKYLASMLPEYETNKFTTDNFLPTIKKDIIEKLLKFDVLGFVKAEYSDFISEITSSEKDIKEGRKKIPLYFLNPNIPLEERSKDVSVIFGAFAKMALNYKAAVQVEDAVNNAIEVTKRSKQSYENPNSPTNLISIMEYTRDANIYGERYAKDDWANKILDVERYATKDAKKKALDLTKEISDLSEKFNNTENEKERDSLLVEINNKKKELSSLPGGKVIISKVIDKMIDIQSKKAFAFNPFSAATNLFFGLISNYSYSAGGRFVDDKSMTKAFGIMMKSTAKFMSANKFDTPVTKKILNLMDRFQIETKTTGLYGIDNGPIKGFWSRMIDKGFFLMKGSDYFMRGQFMVAFAINEQNSLTVLDNAGNQVTKTVWDFLDTEGNLKPEYNEDSFNTAFNDSRNTLLELQKTVHGNFDPMSTPQLKKYAVGRALAQFRLSWVAEGVRSRFQGEQSSETLGTTKGRYITLFEQGFFKNIFWNQFKYLFNKGVFNELSELDRSNMKRNMRELYILEVLSALGLLLKHAYDDEDEKPWYYNVASNLLNRSAQDITFYVSPTSFTSILKNPVPALGVIIDAENAVKTSLKYITDEDYETKHFLMGVGKPFVGPSAIIKAINWSEKKF